MSQIIEQDAVQSDEYYKQEIRRMLEEIKIKNKRMDEAQIQIEAFEKSSSEKLKSIDLKIQEIEKILK